MMKNLSYDDSSWFSIPSVSIVAPAMAVALAGGASSALPSEGAQPSGSKPTRTIVVGTNGTRRYGIERRDEKQAAYARVAEALRSLERDGPGTLTVEAYEQGMRVLSLLHVLDIDAPLVAPQDEDSVTFVWRTGGDVASFLSISEGQVSALRSQKHHVDILASSPIDKGEVIDVLNRAGGNGSIAGSSTYSQF